MKSTGFETKYITITEDTYSHLALPEKLHLWGDLTNYSKINTDNRNIKAFLLYYYEELIAGVLFYEKNYFGILKVSTSPHNNLSGSYGHIYIKKQDSQRAQEQLQSHFVKELTRCIAKNNYVDFTLALPLEYPDIREFLWNGWEITPRYTYILDLAEIKATGLSEYVGKKIRNIIKNTKEKFVVKPISAEEFYPCYQETYARQNKKVSKPKSYFEKIQAFHNVHFYGAFLENEVTSAIAVCESGDTAYFITSGAKTKYFDSNGVTHLLYTYIEHLLEEKSETIKVFDLVGANSKNVANFKTNFNPKLKEHFIVGKSNFVGKLAKKAHAILA